MNEQPAKPQAKAAQATAQQGSEAKALRVSLTPAAKVVLEVLARDLGTNASAVVETALIGLYSAQKIQAQNPSMAARIEYLIGMVEDLQNSQKE